jgi:serine/threonine protein kinase
MPLSPGTRLGSYEIVAPLGAGGMGEVYRATDTNLKRQVAIKVLPQTVGADPERLARFQREAEVLAALNHPNIAHIHGLEKPDGTLALVMELVEGPTLADRIAKEPIPLDEALTGAVSPNTLPGGSPALLTRWTVARVSLERVGHDGGVRRPVSRSGRQAADLR